MSAQSAMAGNDERRGTAGASELLINPWARSTGWGGVNISSVRGIDAMFNNAAGLAFVNNIEVAYTNTILYGGKSGFNSGASINTFGLGVRVFESGVLGVYVMTIGFGDLPVTTYDSPEPGSNGTFSPSYMNINVAYAHSFTNTMAVSSSSWPPRAPTTSPVPVSPSMPVSSMSRVRTTSSSSVSASKTGVPR